MMPKSDAGDAGQARADTTESRPTAGAISLCWTQDLASEEGLTLGLSWDYHLRDQHG